MVDLIFWFMELLFELALYVTYHYYVAVGWFASVANQIQSSPEGIPLGQGVESMLPGIVTLAIGALVTYLVTNGLKEVSQWTGRDLSGNAAVITAAVTAIIVFGINTILSTVLQINPALQGQIDGVLQILVILLGAIGFKRTETNITQGIASMIIAAQEAREEVKA